MKTDQSKMKKILNSSTNSCRFLCKPTKKNHLGRYKKEIELWIGYKLNSGNSSITPKKKDINENYKISKEESVTIPKKMQTQLNQKKQELCLDLNLKIDIF